MIRVERTALPSALAEDLGRRTQRIVREKLDGKKAKALWKGARTCRRDLQSALQVMAAGLNRCMYCSDSEGTAVDHHEPVTHAPERTFDWPNHLLACSHCNSHAKGDRFPVDADGSPLLIDPSGEDPLDHLDLTFSNGEYTALTPKGEVSIYVFDLNRFVLRQGRADAFIEARGMLCLYLDEIERERRNEAGAVHAALARRPYADVREAMTRKRALPGAELVLGGSRVIRALEVLMSAPSHETSRGSRS
ncbi:HNH endonuclease family protein [Nocardiopsis quinghaiensis]|uniref:HNH endonuclease n=1 Tax=Nocardiopsis quinghaiensis TaxID=464995 RepID=UPI001CC23032|nr:HNH endonuclease [Nocardiopsis quinghaiensis]